MKQQRLQAQAQSPWQVQVTNFETFANLSDGDTTYYAIVDNTNNAFEVGLGTFTASGTTLARTTIIASSNSNNAVNSVQERKMCLSQCLQVRSWWKTVVTMLP